MSEFSQLYRNLIGGEIIDKVRFANDFELLCQEQYFQRTNDWLAKLDMQCQKLSSGAGFYAAYSDSQNPTVRQQAKTLFKEFTHQLKPLVMWLGICLHVQGDRPLQAGDKLNHSELLASLEESLHQQEQLRDIIKSINRSTVNSTAKDQLNSVLDYLEKGDYLVSKGSSGGVYIATAKWDFLYENLSFIALYENMAIDEAQALPADQLGLSYE